MASLRSIKVGDIVKVDIRGTFLAFVTDTERPGILGIRPVSAGIGYRTCTARQVVGHWRKRQV